MTATPALVRAPDASNDSRLTETDLDAAIAERVNAWKHAQGRFADVDFHDEEFPSLQNVVVLGVCAVVIVVTVVVSIYFPSWVPLW